MKYVPVHHSGGRVRLPKPEQGNDPIKTLDSLKTHLQTALAVELSTIPLYLYGIFSVNQSGGGSDVIKAVRNVVNEEMLHLALVGNTLRAIGSAPTLYDPTIVPHYPGPMIGRTPELILQLRPMTKDNLETFIEVETPEKSGAPPEPDEYQTLGQFYAAIEQGLTYVNSTVPTLFQPASVPFQFVPGPDAVYTPAVSDAGGLVTVLDLQSALDAMSIIVAQGEGNPGPYDDPSKQEKDHFAIFSDLKSGTADWNVLAVPTNPKSDDYNGTPLYKVSLTFDAAFCYLLLTLQKLWTVSDSNGRSGLVNNMFTIMLGILPQLSSFLTSHPYAKGVAGPCFGYYKFVPQQELSQLSQEMVDAIAGYASDPPSQATLKSIQGSIAVLQDINKV